MNDLFISLKKYRPGQHRTPSENFLTEAFAWLLKNHLEFSQYYIKWLSKRIDVNIDLDNHTWTTQANFNGYFPDLICESSGMVLIFEHKLFSNLHANQLNNYREYAEDNYTHNQIILITANTSQHEQNPDLALCWEEVHKIINTWSEKIDSKKHFSLFENFTKLLEYEGLGPKAPISHESIQYFLRTKDFLTNTETLIKDILNEIDVKFRSQIPKNEFNLSFRHHHGRIGLEFHNSWTPCIFFGVIYDWEGHKAKPIMSLNSPDLVAMLCFDNHLHDKYPLDIDYLNLVSELKGKSIENEWEIYIQLENEIIEESNKWHPVYIRKPLLKVLEGTLDFVDQKNKFIAALTESVELFISSNNFKKLKEKYK